MGCHRRHKPRLEAKLGNGKLSKPKKCWESRLSAVLWNDIVLE